MRKTTTFRSVLVRNEYMALRGKRHSTIVYLFFILFMTFLAFGFAKSTLTYQKKLSADPFSNWINLNFHSGTRDSLRTLHEKISGVEFRERFHLKGSYFYNKGMIPVFTRSEGNKIVQYEARTIDPLSGIVKDLLKSGVCSANYPDSTENVFKNEPNGVIVTRKLVNEIGWDAHSISFIQIKSPVGDMVPVPVIAVVNELPDLSDIAYTNLFYCKTMNPGFYDRENSCYRIFIENMDTAGIFKVIEELNTALEISDPSTVQTTGLVTGNRSVLNWKIEIGAQEKDIPISVMNERLASLASLRNHHFGQYFELSKDTACDNSSFYHDYLAIEFTDLEKIGDFSKYLNDKLMLHLNLEVLAHRENYLYTGNIAIGSIILLMILSIISVSIYISGVIRHHLEKIKKNLGNFLAFGIKKNTLTWIYIWVTVKILAVALFPAMALAFACGEIFEKFLLGKLLVLDPDQDYFSLSDSWVGVFIVLILFVAITRTFISVNKILRHTPGDLIYERAL
ncbi:MAG: FtsX-like permease family protein [Bacteroidales bacterium]|nr:FtsX-like permease family protein [Bacteroidales bacterium]